MLELLEVKLDEHYIEETFREELKKRLDQLQSQEVFWDMKTLCEKTKMSVNTIKDTFFYDDRFPKTKVGQKWYFPAEETKRFLLQWLNERR